MFKLATVVMLCLVAGCVSKPPVHDELNWQAEEFKPPAAPPVTNAVVPAPATHIPAPTVLTRAATNFFDSTWVSLDAWSKANQIGTLHKTSAGASPSYTFLAGKNTFTSRIGSRAARWNGVELNLGFAPQNIGGTPYFHTLDIQKNILPLLGDHFPQTNAACIVVIDPGHGGSDKGAVSIADGRSEKEFTLDVAHRLEPLLAARGWTIHLTRTNDSDMSLAQRVAFAESKKAELFISIHFNSAAPNREQSGIESYCLTPRGMPSTLVREFADDATLSFTNNLFDHANVQLAMRLQRFLLCVEGARDRGVRRARFMGVLRGQSRPAVLLECGYLSNEAEAARIGQPEHRQKIAEAIASALAESPLIKAEKPDQGGETHSISHD